MTRLHNNRRVRGIIPEVHAVRGYDFFFPACMDFFQEAEEIVFLRAGPLGFIAHADPGAMGAGIDDVRVPGRQQGSLVGTAGAVPDIVANIVVKAPVEKTGELVSGTHPQKQAAYGERQIHAAVHDAAGGKRTGIKPDFFPSPFRSVSDMTAA